MLIDEILTYFEGVKKNGQGFKALCPAHDDHNPSLSIDQKGGKILLTCHTGCHTESIMQQIGLEVADLFNESKMLPLEKQVAGKPIDPTLIEELRQACTKEVQEYLKKQRAITPDIVERYKIGLQNKGERRIIIPIANESGTYVDARRWLPPEIRTKNQAKILHWSKGYGAPRLFPIDQLQAGELVLCEGELDALALISHGIPAITATCGVTTWPNSLSENFNKKTVVILTDNDDAGRQGAQLRANSLAAAGALVKIATWPKDRSEGWDATDELKTSIENVKTFISTSQSFQIEDQWPEPQPLKNETPEVAKFDYLLLPPGLEEWIKDTAELMQCPPDFLAVPAIIGLAAVVGRQIAIRPQEYDDWTVVPNLFGAIVGSPGLMKTAAADAMLEPLKQLDIEGYEDYKEAQRDHEIQILIAEEAKKITKQKIAQDLKMGIDPLLSARDELTEPEEPARKRIMLHDTTIEKLGEILNQNPRGVLIFRDELTGWLRSLERDGREGDRAFYLEAWNGTGRFTYDRIGRGTTEIEAACVSIFGCIQPGPLTHYMQRASLGGADNDGLVQRFQLVVWPNTPKDWTLHDRKPNKEAKEAARQIYQRLNNIDLESLDAQRDGDLPYLRFSPDAQEIFNEWRDELEAKIRSGNEPEILEAHLAKYRSLIPSLALLIHLADGNPGPVSEDATGKACGWADYLETHARKIYAPALNTALFATHSLAKRIINRELSSDFTNRDIYRREWSGLSSKEDVQEAIETLEELDWIKSNKEKTAGRSKISYAINPKIVTRGVKNE